MSTKLISLKPDPNTYLSLMLKVVLTVFTILAVGFSELGLTFPSLLILIIIFFLNIRPTKSLSVLNHYPNEIKLLNLWFIFAFVTGVFVSVSHEDLFISLKKILLTVLICNCLIIILLNRVELIKYIMLGILISGVLNALSVQLGYGTEYVENTGRAIGLQSNPNSLGLSMAHAISATLFFFLVLKKNKTIYLFLIACLLIFGYTIFLSGSRKSLLSFVVLALLFTPILITKNKKRTSKNFIFYSAIILLVAYLLLSYFLPIFIEGTAVSERLEMGASRGGVQGDIRYTMYLAGVEIFLDKPLFGVGLGNYKNYFYTGQYSHSDYIESLTGTGLLGFLLYQSVYIVIIFKSIILFIKSKNVATRLYSAISIIFMINLKVIGTGVILFYSPTVAILIATCSGIAYSLRTTQSKLNNK